jgi:hypothetical protein
LFDFSNGFCKASIKISIEFEISGFLIVYPIRLRAYEAVLRMLGCAFDKHVDNVGTIIGNEVWS